MGINSEPVQLVRAALDTFVEQAGDDPRKLASLAALALSNGDQDRAYALACRARELAPGNPTILSLTAKAIAATVPSWHFGIVRDAVRNEVWDAALRRAVGPDSTVLDIGAGTGLLAMMAARAGARAVFTCEMNRAVADAARDIVAANGFADRIEVIAQPSNALSAEDLGGRVDVIVSEIVSNDLLAEHCLGAMEHAVDKLLRPGGTVIPAAGSICVALAHWSDLDTARMAEVAGFDLSPFNRLAQIPSRLKVGDPALALCSEPRELFAFDFASGGPYRAGRASTEPLTASAPANGIVQWIRLQLDAETSYENRPAPGAASCWAARFFPFDPPLLLQPGASGRIAGAHDRHSVRIWLEQ